MNTDATAPARCTRIRRRSAELRNSDIAGLEAEIRAQQKAHFGLRMQKGTQQLTNNSTLRSTRRDIARAKTILAQKRTAALAALPQATAPAQAGATPATDRGEA